MPGDPGRTTEPRTLASVTKTAASANITAPAGTFTAEDKGRTITGTGIPAGATITAVSSDTAATMSANATAAGTASATLGAADPRNTGYTGWIPETYAEAGTYTVAAVNSGAAYPGKITDPSTGRKQRGR
jgi:hypothetical protein